MFHRLRNSSVSPKPVADYITLAPSRGKGLLDFFEHFSAFGKKTNKLGDRELANQIWKCYHWAPR